MRVSDFDFDLPPERIALRPAAPARIRASCLSSAPIGWRIAASRICRACLRPGDVLVFNDTKVIPAALSRPAHRPRRNHAEDRGAAAHAARRQPLEGLCQARQEAAGGRPAGLRRKRLQADGGEQGRGGRGHARLRSVRTGSRCGPAGRGRDALAALYRGQARRRRAGPCRLPDDLRREGRRRGCAHRRAALHAEPDEVLARCWNIDRIRNASCRGRDLPAGQGGRYRRPQDACRVGRGVGGRCRAAGRSPRGRRPDRGRGHDLAAVAGKLRASPPSAERPTSSSRPATGSGRWTC